MMKTKILFLILFFGLFGLAKSLWAATYYSDFLTGSDNNVGTQNSPWKYAPGMSGWSGSAMLTSGDMVILKGGVTWTFASTTDNLWTLPASITIKGGQQLLTPWGSGLPVLDGSGTTADRMGIELNSKTDVIIDGIKIYNTEMSPSGGSGIYALGSISNLEIKNCVFDHTGDQSMRIGPSGGNSSHILIHDNITSNVGRLFFAVPDGINVDDVQIYNNTFLGVGLWPGGIVGHAHGDGIMIGSECTAANTCLTNLFIHHNKFSGDWSGGGESGATALIFLQNGSASGETQYGGNHVQIYNNQMAIDTDGIISPAYLWLWAIWNDVKIYNNTFGGYYSGLNPVSNCISLDKSTNIDIKNNIFSGCTNTAINTNIGTNTNSMSIDYNYYSSEIVRFINGWNGTSADCRTISDCYSYFEQEQNGKTGDPKFITLPNGTVGHGDWNVQLSSPVIDAGISLLSYFTTDILGTSRPQGSGWDIGAYEYVSGTSDTTPPATPSGLSVQ